MADEDTEIAVYAIVQINEPKNEYLDKKLLTVPTGYIIKNADEFFVRYAVPPYNDEDLSMIESRKEKRHTPT